MKIIQDRELERICMMIRSEDKEIRELANTLLCKKQSIRFSLTTIVLFHLLLLFLSLVAAFTLTHHYTYGIFNYITFLFVAIQAIFSIYYIRVVADFRIAYNESIKQLFG